MANTTIKISQLPTANALTANTLLPIVSTTGTLITDKVTLGTLANYVLTEAGNLLPAAFVSELAYSIVNAAQPNITSVGTLANLSITDVSVLNIPGGTNGYVLQTNGDGNLNWTAMAGSGNGSPGGANSQIQFNDSGLFNGLNTLTFDAGNATLNTVNIAASNATIYETLAVSNINANNFTVNNFTTTGNIEANYFIGNGSQLTGVISTAVAAGPNLSVQFNNDESLDGSSNLTYDVSTSTLNIIQMNVSTGGNIYEDGSALIIRTEPTHIFEVWGNDGASDYKWSFDQDGHLTLPGNTAYVRGDVDLIQFYNNSAQQSGVSVFENFEISATDNVILFANNNGIPYLWTFDNTGNLTLPGNTFAVNYANGDPVPLGGSSGSELVNGDNSFVLDNDGNVVFEGIVPGQGINRGMVWDYGANVGGVNSEVRQDNNGITVRAWTENGGGISGFSAPVNIVTNQDATENRWVFDGQGNLTLPGNLRLAAGNIQSDTIAPAFNSAIADITTGNPTVIVTLAAGVFEGPFSGTVTISSVTGTIEADGVWGYQAVEFDQFQLYTDATLTTPVDGTTWTTYVSGGTAVGTGVYSDLTVQGGNVSVSSNNNNWIFGTDGNLTVPGNLNAINDGGQLGAQIQLSPDLGLAKMAARTVESLADFTSSSWNSAEYTGSQVNFTNAPSLINFLTNSQFSAGVNRTMSINGGSRVLYQGYGTSGNDVIVYTDVPADPDPTSVTTIDFYYQLESSVSVDYDDGGLYINATGMSIYVENDQTQGPDIWLRSGDDITLQAKDKSLGSESEGGDINIYAGDGSGDDGAGNTSGGGGDIQLVAGMGGYGNNGSGSAGGFARIQAGPGGDAGVTNVAGDGGFIEINAGDGGNPLGNAELGGLGGYVDIYAGATTLANSIGGNVSIRSGVGGGDAIAGNVQIITPASGLGSGGTWTFDGNGNLLLAGGNSVIQSVPNNAGDSSGLSTLNLIPDSSTGDDRYIIIDPTGPSHIHIRAGGTQDASNSYLYLGGEQTHVQINDFEKEVTIRSYDAGNTLSSQWIFGNTGILTLPTNNIAINYANGSPAFGNMVAWTDAPVSNISAGTPGQAAYDSGGNLYVCVASDTWAKFTGTTSW